MFSLGCFDVFALTCQRYYFFSPIKQAKESSSALIKVEWWIGDCVPVYLLAKLWSLYVSMSVIL